MKGKVLGFDPASGSGAITGDDGNRYSFTATDNKGGVPLKANDTVDFEVEGNTARNIYVVKTGFAMPSMGDGSAGGATMSGNEFVQKLLARPYVLWAAIVILGSLIAGYLSTLQLIGGGPMGMLGAAGFFYALLFFIPVLAGVLIFFEYTNNALTPVTRLATGAFAAAGPIVLPLIGNMMLPGMLGGLGGYGGLGGILSFGSIVTIAGGLLILATYFGFIKKLA